MTLLAINSPMMESCAFGLGEGKELVGVGREWSNLLVWRSAVVLYWSGKEVESFGGKCGYDSYRRHCGWKVWRDDWRRIHGVGVTLGVWAESNDIVIFLFCFRRCLT